MSNLVFARRFATHSTFSLLRDQGFLIATSKAQLCMCYVYYTALGREIQGQLVRQMAKAAKASKALLSQA